MAEHATSSTSRHTPDEIVNEIFRIKTERNPDADPGDITIDVQDDMPMVTVMQSGLGHAFAPFVAGGSIQEALENALEVVRRG